MAANGTSRFGVALYSDSGNRQIPDDFAGVDAPKLKFNFTLSFQYTDMLRGTTEGSDDPYTIDFGIKQITRPAPNVMYEDVNFYNFMTKVATKVEFGVVTVTLYDDRSNKAHDIFKNYMEAISPITKVNRDLAPLMDTLGQSTTTGIGPLSEGARHGPIKSIRVKHITNHLGKSVIYDFLNPKIQNAILDELDMTQGDVNTITFTFLYDSYTVTTSEGTAATEEETLSIIDVDSISVQKREPDNLSLKNQKIKDSQRDGIALDPSFYTNEPTKSFFSDPDDGG